MNQPKSHNECPLLLAALSAADPIPKGTILAPMDLSPIPKEAPVMKSSMDFKPTGAQIAAFPQLETGKLWLLQQSIAAILPVIHLVPGPEKILVTHGIRVLKDQAPDLLEDLLPVVEAARKVARVPANNDLKAVIKFINDSRQ